MRKFSLFCDGSEIKLNGEEHVWFTNPAGLGIDLAPQFINLRNGFFAPVVSDIRPQMNIVGEITLMPYLASGVLVPPYIVFETLLNSLNSAKILEFGYTPVEGQTQYRIRVALNYITKTEMDNNWLTCPVSFAPLTPWYKTDTVTVPFAVDVGFADVYRAKVTPLGHIPAAFEIKALNGGTPKSVSFASASDYQSFGIQDDAIIDTRGTFELSTKYDDSYARFTAGSTITDLINFAEINPDIPMFPRLTPRTENQIVITYLPATPKPLGGITINVYSYYWSV